MKKLLFVASVAAMLPVAGFSENGLKYSYAKDMYGDLNVGYSAKPVVSREEIFYLGGRAELSFASWENEYKDQNNLDLGNDKFDFKPMLGLDLFVGYKFNQNFRADIEFGYLGQYKESETEYPVGYLPHKDTFSFDLYYMTANAYYDIKYGWYVGAGAGAAISHVAMDDSWFGRKSKTSVSPVGAFMLGWVNELGQNTDLDIRYRFSMFDGGKVTVDTGGGTAVKTEMGYVMDNSLSVGVRCYF